MLEHMKCELNKFDFNGGQLYHLRCKHKFIPEAIIACAQQIKGYDKNLGAKNRSVAFELLQYI